MSTKVESVLIILTKDQLISTGLFGAIIWTKKPNNKNYFQDICPSL